MGRRRTYEDEDEEDRWEEDRPRLRRRKHRGSRAPLIIILVLCGILLVGGGGFLVYWFAIRPKEQLQKNEERLVGRWSTIAKETPRTVAVFDFRADGTFGLTMTDARGVRAASQGTWKVASAKGDKLRISTVRGGKSDADMNIEFLSADRFRHTSDGRIFTFTRVR